MSVCGCAVCLSNFIRGLLAWPKIIEGIKLFFALLAHFPRLKNLKHKNPSVFIIESAPLFAIFDPNRLDRSEV